MNLLCFIIMSDSTGVENIVEIGMNYRNELCVVTLCCFEVFTSSHGNAVVLGRDG